MYQTSLKTIPSLRKLYFSAVMGYWGAAQCEGSVASVMAEPRNGCWSAFTFHASFYPFSVGNFEISETYLQSVFMIEKSQYSLLRKRMKN